MSASGTTGDFVAEMLREYGDATRALLFRYLPDREPRRYLHDLLGDYPSRGGRAFRPTLCIATVRAFGRPLEDAILTAVSIELMHNAMLIHDDVEDESEERRGKPALHITQGVPIAINVGDALSLISLRPLLDNRWRLGAPLTFRILQEAERMAFESAEGQAMELGWRRDNATDVTESDYLTMVLKKTCWLAAIYPSRVGALIGSGGAFDVEPLIRFGFLVGAAFQIQDDLLNLVGDAKRYGKELCGDLYEGKRTIMLIRLFEVLDEDGRNRLCALLARSRQEREAAEVRWVASEMDRLGCIDYARAAAHGLAGAAQHECDAIYGALPDSRDKRFIEAIPAWVLARS